MKIQETVKSKIIWGLCKLSQALVMMGLTASYLFTSLAESSEQYFSLLAVGLLCVVVPVLFYVILDFLYQEEKRKPQERQL